VLAIEADDVRIGVLSWSTLAPPSTSASPKASPRPPRPPSWSPTTPARLFAGWAFGWPSTTRTTRDVVAAWHIGTRWRRTTRLTKAVAPPGEEEHQSACAVPVLRQGAGKAGAGLCTGGRKRPPALAPGAAGEVREELTP